MKKIDLHTHTISTVSDSSFEFDLSKLKDYVDRLNIDALAITNHNQFDQAQYFIIRNAVSIPVFPGIEIDLEGGHILVITDTDEFEVTDFDEKCKQVSAMIKTDKDMLNLEQFRTIFPDLTKYILIPHYDKTPKIKKETIDALKQYITAGEVASVAKFIRLHKETDDLVPVLFSDIRFKTNLVDYPTRQTFVDLREITLSGIKSCLLDRTKVSLTKESGNEFFQATGDGLELSTGLNIILGARSSGKTVTLNKIASSSGNAKYIEQFSLLQNSEEAFNRANDTRHSLINNNFLAEFKAVVEDVLQVDIKRNHLEVETYLESLIKYANESEREDLYSKCALFTTDSFAIDDLTNLDKLIESATFLIENKEYQDVILKHVSEVSLKNLAVELIQKAIDSKIQNEEKKWLNTIIGEIQRELRIKTVSPFIEQLSFYDIALGEMKIKKFISVVNELKVSREIARKSVGKFSIVTSNNPIVMASDLVKIGKDRKTYSVAFGSYNKPYEYMLKLREIGVEDASLYRFFVKIESETLNVDGVTVSGGERSEFNLIHEIKDATQYDILLIDEPESSFDNLFLRKEINTLIKEISSLMPVVVVTHNSTVGASIKPNYIAITEKEIVDKKPIYKIYTGYPSDKELKCIDGSKIKNYDTLLNCLEAGIEAYSERKTQAYEILKD